MVEINWWLWAGFWIASWLWQNVSHELSHLRTGWYWEGRKPIKLVPVPHRYQGRWYWARYESGPATRADAAQHEYRRHSAPLRWAHTQVLYLGGCMAGAGVVLWVPWVRHTETHEFLLAFIVYSVPFVVCPLVDVGVWLWGYLARRPGTDGDRWRQAVERR